MIKSRHGEHLTLISLPRYFQEAHSCAKISEFCHDKSISFTKKEVLFYEIYINSLQPKHIKTTSMFKKVVGHKDVTVP